MSRAQLLDNDDLQSSPSDSQPDDDESELGDRNQKDGSDTAEQDPQQLPQPGVAQALNQTRQEEQKKGLAVSRQLVRRVPPFSNNPLML